MRAVGLIALTAGAVGSLDLLLHASQHPPGFLLALFIVWVLSPFVALAVADRVSRRFPILAGAPLYGLMVLLALGSLACYGGLVSMPQGSRPAFVFLFVPSVSFLLMIVVLRTAALITRFRSHGPGRTK